MTANPIPIEELDTMPAAAFVAALAPLFEGAETLLVRLASDRPFGSWWNLLARARVVAHALPEADQIALLNAHPRLGAPPEAVSPMSFEEQGYGRDGIAWPAEDGLSAGAPGLLDEDRPIGEGEPSPAPATAPPPAPPPPSMTAGLRGRLEQASATAPSATPAERPMWGAASSAGAAPMRERMAAAAARSGGTDEGDSTRARLARLNAAYEDWFGFRYCVFVAGRPLEALIPELEAAMAQSRDHELARGVDAVVDIAVARSGAAR
jgi:2-oxo-4-hydroxy-4-carboxy--5-ureidoimidazoline (OHCU) decarboxylase